MNYPGGKGAEGVYQAIINQMPPHRVYIEAFLGGGAILRHKKPAEINYGVEINQQQFMAWQWSDCNGFPDAAVGRDNYQNCDKLGRGSLTIYNTDFLKFARNLADILGKRSTFIYLDPPYVQEVRSNNKRMYDSEFSDWFSHEELLSYILTLGCNVMISGYEHPVYDSKLSGWRKVSFQGLSRGGRTVETIWMNYPEPAELHDYRYVGDGYREREAIQKRQKNWIGQLRDMKPLHRKAMLARLNAEFAGDHAPPEKAMPADTAEIDGAIAPEISQNSNGLGTLLGNEPSGLASLIAHTAESGEPRENGNVPATIADAGGGAKRSPTKGELATQCLVENFWPAEVVAAAIAHKYPWHDLLAKTPAGKRASLAKGTHQMLDKQKNGWRWGTEGKHIRIWSVKNNVTTGVSFGTTTDALAKKIVDVRAKACTAKNGDARSRKVSVLKAHVDLGLVNDSGVFNKYETIVLKKKGRAYAYAHVAFSPVLDRWCYGSRFQLEGPEWHGGGGLPSIGRDADAATRDEAIEKATLRLRSHSDVAKFLDKADRSPAKKTVRALV